MSERGCFLNVERSLTGKRWEERLADSRQALALSQQLGLPEIIGRVLAARGVDDFHIYTLNRADLTAAVCRLLRNDTRARLVDIEEPKLLAGGLS